MRRLRSVRSLVRWDTVAWCAVLLACVLVLTASGVALPGDDLGIRRFRTPPLAPDIRLGQTFAMEAEGLDAVEFRADAIGDRVSGHVLVSLYDVTREAGPRPVVRSEEVSAEDLVRGSSYRFEFPPILDSRYRTYRLELAPSEADPPEGVAFWATRGERYADGALRINGADRWADLAFQTHAPALSTWQLLRTLQETNPARAYAVIAAFAAMWILLAIGFRLMAGRANDGVGRAAAS